MKAALCRALSGLPEWIELIPAGKVRGRDGRTFELHDAEAVIAASIDGILDIVVDFEHATEVVAPEGGEAPAAGWVRELEARDGAVWGRIEWTERGAQSIERREYRYVSPAILTDERRTVRQLVSVGLTNKPNLRLPALNRQTERKEMDEEILTELGLAPGASRDDVIAAIRARGRPTLEGFVPRADHELALNRARTAESRLAERELAERNAEIEALLDRAVREKKIAPASLEYHRASARSDGGIDRLRKFVDEAPALLGEVELHRQPPAGVTGAEVREVAMATGQDPEKVAAALKRIREGGE